MVSYHDKYKEVLAKNKAKEAAKEAKAKKAAEKKAAKAKPIEEVKEEDSKTTQ